MTPPLLKNEDTKIGLFPTDAEARKWGVRRIKVTVWEYADGQGAENWRAIRDSKN